MHILFLSDNFPPEVNAPASRTHEHCRQWVKAGHRVTVITCAPNFPKGRVFAGYRNKLWQREQIDGIDVIRVWTYITANEGFARRVLDYLSYMFSGALAGLLVKDVQVVVGTSPQFFTACAAWFVGAVRRIPFVFELRDLWPESIKAVGAMKDSIVIRLLERIELALYRRAARIVVVTRSFRETLIERGIDPAKIDVITNGVDLVRFAPRAKDVELVARLKLEGKFVAGYIGTHGMAHALETLLQAAAQLRSLPGGNRFILLFLGEGAAKSHLQERARQLNLDEVLFLDSVPKDEVVRYWSLLDASIIHLRHTQLFSTVIPSKIFESMAMGIPILLGVQGEAASIVERENAGILFEPENAHELVEGVTRLLNDPGLCAGISRACVTSAKRYERSNLAQDMLRIIERTMRQ